MDTRKQLFTNGIRLVPQGGNPNETGFTMYATQDALNITAVTGTSIDLGDSLLKTTNAVDAPQFHNVTRIEFPSTLDIMGSSSKYMSFSNNTVSIDQKLRIGEMQLADNRHVGFWTHSNNNHADIHFLGGNVGIGTNQPETMLHVTGDVTFDTKVYNLSDIRYKEDLKVIDQPLHKISKLSGYTYVRKDLQDKSRHAGVIAQEVLAVLPEAINGDPKKRLTVSYDALIPLLIEAVKELKGQVDRLDDKVRLGM